MEHQETKKGTTYFQELSLRFYREGVEHGEPTNGAMPILQNGDHIGAISESGRMILTRDKMWDSTADRLRDRAGSTIRKFQLLMQLELK